MHSKVQSEKAVWILQTANIQQPTKPGSDGDGRPLVGRGRKVWKEQCAGLRGNQNVRALGQLLNGWF